MNCRDRCNYSKLCERMYKTFKGEDGLTGDDCPMYWKIDDLMIDARSLERELAEEDDVPFCEPYNGPEEEEEC